MPWWGWSLLVLVLGVVAFLAAGVRSFRAAVRRELAAFIAERGRFQVVRARARELALRDGDGQVIVLQLANLYRVVTALPREDVEGRRAQYRIALESLEEGLRLAAGALDLARDGDALLPRWMPPAARLASGAPLVFRAVPELGLDVVYVVDMPHGVLFLTAAHLAALGLSPDALHERALANLRRRSPELGAFLEPQGALAVLKTGDTYDAARLLLVPGLLEAGRELAAVIPDRDTLGVLPIPDDGDWSAARRLAGRRAGPPLLGRPVIVSRAGFRPAP